MNSLYTSKRTNPLKGFTLVELLVGTFLASIISLSIFSVFINSSDFYGKRLDQSQAQSSLRFAMEYMKSDLRDLGRMSILSTDIRVRDPDYCGIREYVGLELADNDIGSEFYQPSPTLSDNDIMPDRLRVLMDASNATPLRIRSISGTSVSLSPTLQQPTTEARRLTGLGADEHFTQLFDQASLTRITNLTTGRYDLIPTNDARLLNGAGQVTLANAPCNDLNCGSGSCVVNPVHWFEYAVLSKDDDDEHTYLARRRLSLNDGSPLPNQELIIADYVVDFQVWGHYDTRGQNANAVGQLSSLLAPQLPDDADPNDDRGNWAPAQAEDQRLELWTHRLRGLNIMLAARAARVDPNLTIDVFRAGMGSQERSTLRLKQSPGTGRAYVSTMVGVIDTQNLYRGE